MWPQRSQREWEVSQRIWAPQLSQSMSLTRRILPSVGRPIGTTLPHKRAAQRLTAASALARNSPIILSGSAAE